ncbi:MAG TPA: DUF4399 domain-containing protein, partial [Burkholderiaceae bacterium]|nr:DUF4399 domain-containing protein [Burkholderiaceae bacterium]
MHKIVATALIAAFFFCQGANAADPPAPGSAWLYIGWPNDGEVIAAGKPFRVWFGLRNMGVAPKDVQFPNTGHHHLLIDTELPPMDQE